MSDIFIYLIISVLAIVSIARPWYSLAAILILELLGPLVPAMQDIRGLSIIAVCGSIGILPYAARGNIRGWPLVWPVSFFVLFVINFTISGQMPSSFIYLLAGGFCAYYLTLFSIRSRKQALAIACVAIVVAVGCCIVSFFDFRSAVSSAVVDSVYAGRIHVSERTVAENPNYLLPLVMPGLFFAFLLYFTWQARISKILLSVCIGTILLGVFSTISRGSFLSLLSIISLIIILRGKRSLLRGIVGVVPILIIIAGLFFFVPDIFNLIKERFLEGDNYEVFGSRSSLALIAFRQLLGSPLWGSGLGATIASVGSTQHDGYMGVLGEMGLLGFIVFYSLPFILLFKVHRARKIPANTKYVQVLIVFEAFMVGILVLNMFNPIMYSKSAYLLMAVVQLFLMGMRGSRVAGALAIKRLLGFNNVVNGNSLPVKGSTPEEN